MKHWREAKGTCLVALLMLAGSVAASPVEVSIPSPVKGPFKATVYLEKFSELSPLALRDKTVFRQVTLPWQGVVDVAENIRARLEVRGQGFWCKTDKIGTSYGNKTIEPVGCRMAPAGVLTGKLHVSPLPVPALRFLRIAYQSTSLEVKESAPNTAVSSRSLVFCAVDDNNAFECPLPVGVQDLRLDLEGYGSQYLWGQTVGAGTEKKLGKLSFRKGASVAGAVAGRGLAEVPDASVELRPRLAARGYRSDQRAIELRSFTARVDKEGKFVFLGVTPGEYVLAAKAADFCKAESRVRVSGGDALVHLQDPIVLDSCVRLEAFVEPTSDFGGESWSLTLQEVDAVDSSGGIVRTEAVALSGSAVVGDLEAGVYDFEIRDHAGDAWWSRDIDVYAGMSPVFIEIDAVCVRGSASSGEEPIDGKLIFGTRNRRPSVSLEIDEEGSFEGYLPFEGQWALELERGGQRQFLDATTVEVPAGKSCAEVEISLPDTLVAGKVVEGGEPIAGAIVTVLRDADGLEKEMFAESDEDGEFLFSGMRAGSLQLRAAFGRLVSEWRFLTLEDGDEIEDVDLELAPTITVQGRVSAQGAGVPGARIVGFPSRSAGSLLPTGGATGADGTFDVKISRDAERLDLAIITPGYEGLLALAQPAARGAVWPAVKIQLQGAGGTVVLQINDPGFSGSVSFGGAAVPLRTFMNLMAQEGRMDREQYQGVSFHDLAAGTWTFCRPGVQGYCVTKELFPGEVAMVELFERSSE